MTAPKAAPPPPAEPVKLGRFEGKKVASTAMKVDDVGKVLTEALEATPLVLHHEDEVIVVLRVRVKGISHPDVKEDDGVARRHDCRAIEGTVVDPTADEVETTPSKLLAAQYERNLLHAEAKIGIDPLPGTTGTATS